MNNKGLVGNINSAARFTVLCSGCGYKTKAAFKQRGMTKVRERTFNLIDFEKAILNGYCFGALREKVRGQYKFNQTYVIAVDIDKATVSCEDTITYLEDNFEKLIPTIAYETFSCVKDDPRFRFLYIFATPIKHNQYLKLYSYITKNLQGLFPNFNIDKSFTRMDQNYVGTSKDSYLYNSHIVFTGEIIEELTNTCTYTQYIPTPNIYPPHKDVNVDPSFNGILQTNSNDILETSNRLYVNTMETLCLKYHHGISSTVLADLYGLSPLEFLDKYKEKYPIYNKTEIDFRGFNCVEMPDGYFNLNWLRKYNGKTFRKRKDGERRRSVLSLYGHMLKYMESNISSDELLYNLVHERTMYYDNMDKTLSNCFLLGIVNQVQSHDAIYLSNLVNKCFYKKMFDECGTRRMVYSKKGGARFGHKASHVGHDQQLMTFDKIDKWYDHSLSPYKNSKRIDSQYSLGTLKRYKKYYDSNILEV